MNSGVLETLSVVIELSKNETVKEVIELATDKTTVSLFNACFSCFKMNDSQVV
jgi:hypothetical protein